MDLQNYTAGLNNDIHIRLGKSRYTRQRNCAATMGFDAILPSFAENGRDSYQKARLSTRTPYK